MPEVHSKDRPADQPEADDAVSLSFDGPAAVISLQHRPHNFLGPTLIRALVRSLGEARRQGARAVMINSGLRNFCAGADLDIFDNADQGMAPDLDTTEFVRAIEDLPIPVIASVHGVCIGGGLELALAADYIVAAESAKFGAVEVTLGINPLSGAIQRLTQRAGIARAKEMAMFGRRFDASTLERWNVINLVVPDDRLPEVSRTLLLELANGPTVAHASTKAIAAYAASHGVQEADREMKALQAPMWASEDVRTGLASLREHGPGAARFEGR